MKKRIIKVLGILVLLLIIHQFYWFNSLNGNLTIYVCNVSERDSLNIDLYLDNKKIGSDTFTNTSFYSFKKYPLNVSLGKHTMVIKTVNGKVLEEYECYTFLVKRVLVEYQGKDNQLDDNKEFLIQSESVFGNLVIQ